MNVNVEYRDLHERFMEKLKESTPLNSQIVTTIQNMLKVDRSAVYRRINGETPFTFEEIARLCIAFNLSADSIILQKKDNRYPFQLYFPQYSFTREHNMGLLDMDNQLYGLAIKSGYSHLMTTSNWMPKIFTLKYPVYRKFMYMIWHEYSNLSSEIKHLTDIKKVEAAEPKINQLYETRQKFTESTVIVYNHSMWEILEMLAFYKAIGMVDDNSVMLIKKELSEYLDLLAYLTEKGDWPEGGRVNIYVSEISLPVEVLLVESDNVNVANMYVFMEKPLTSQTIEGFEIVKSWTRALLKNTACISLSNVHQRHEFLNRQRQELNREI